MTPKQKKAQLRYWIQRGRFEDAQNSKDPKRIKARAEDMESAFEDMQNAVELKDDEFFRETFVKVYGADMRKGMRSSG